MVEFEEGKLFKLFFSQGKYEGAVKNYLEPVSLDDGCLHAKVYLIGYGKVDGNEEKGYVRGIIASANLTNADEVNVCAFENVYL